MGHLVLCLMDERNNVTGSLMVSSHSVLFFFILNDSIFRYVSGVVGEVDYYRVLSWTLCYFVLFACMGGYRWAFRSPICLVIMESL
ncbi:hypothetical protein NPIL_1011 [Nephila pilipes]|uniref:Uncharacterized protein n=1 Tax=Nephila pilipes TaxID=299642 RepID=A0A8X6TJG9_NEPPI|nr:hypothetical protein NPIL_1011 [Nephila pilipes]